MMVSFKFDRFVKVVFLLVMMAFCAIVFWRFDKNSDPSSFFSILSVVVMLVGVVLTARMMNKCMKDVLSMACITMGVYMLVRFFPLVMGDGDISAFFAIAYLFIGFAIIGFGVNLWAGIEFNIVRIRFVALAVMAAAGGYLYYTYVFRTTRLEWFLEYWYIIPMIVMALALFLVANDKSLGFVGAVTNLRHSVRAVGRRMYAVDDAYILRTQAEEIASIVSSAEGEAEFPLRSHTFGNRTMRTFIDEGGPVIAIFAENHVYSDPMIRMRASHVTVRDDHVVIYGEEGYWMRIVLFDELQQDMNKPVLAGRYVDVNKVLGKIFGGLYRY